MLVGFIMVAVFYGIVIFILYATLRRQKGFTDYAVGGRSWGAGFVGMAYVNSWFPGTVFISFVGITVGYGVFGYYGLAYSTLGVVTMYFLATRSWRWGKHYDLHSQPDLLRVRFNSTAVMVIASVIGVVSIFPWVILGMQSMGQIFVELSAQHLGTIASIGIGVALIAIRQIWTIQMGMRGLILTDMFQGIFGYVIASLICVVLLGIPNQPASIANLADLPEKFLSIPGDGDAYGPFYLTSLIFTGVIGSLCWPMSFQRIYTASSVRSVKKATIWAMVIIVGFNAILMTTMLAASQFPAIAEVPQSAWFTLMSYYGGEWLLGLGVVCVLGAAMGHADGCVQVAGLQIANDIFGAGRKLTDRSLIIIAKSSMVVYMLLAAVISFVFYDAPRLQLFAQISYQGVVQLAVPIFCGVFLKFGNKHGAFWGMTSGFVLAVVLTAIYPDDVPALGSITSGIIAMFVNLLVYVIVSALTKTSIEERKRVHDMFEVAAGKHIVDEYENNPEGESNDHQV